MVLPAILQLLVQSADQNLPSEILPPKNSSRPPQMLAGVRGPEGCDAELRSFVWVWREVVYGAGLSCFTGKDRNYMSSPASPTWKMVCHPIQGLYPSEPVPYCSDSAGASAAYNLAAECDGQNLVH